MICELRIRCRLLPDGTIAVQSSEFTDLFVSGEEATAFESATGPLRIEGQSMLPHEIGEDVRISIVDA